MRILSIFKPEYFFNPTQFARRLVLGIKAPTVGQVTARTPWGWALGVHPGEDLGKSVLYLGVYDLVASEVIWRLTDPGETTLDLGANIGYMTGLLARRVGQSGRVVSFEAHPEIAEELRANVVRWRGLAGDRVIRVHELAVSDREGTVFIEEPDEFATNRGIARVAEGSNAGPGGSRVLTVPCGTLDSMVSDIGPIGLAKMDVEGHEAAVLRGAKKALSCRQVRDWVFEHHPEYPSDVTHIFESNGYSIYRIYKSFIGPKLVSASSPVARSAWEPPNFLATCEPDRALKRLQVRGWKVLAGKN